MKNKKYSINIPIDTSVIYSEKKKILTVIGPLKKKSMNLNLKVFIDKNKNLISVSPITFSKISKSKKKKIDAIRNTTLLLIKQVLIETSTVIHKKLKINGVGYRVIFTESFNDKLLTLKLGYSHLIYFKVPETLTVTCPTKTTLCVFGNSYQNVSQIASLIRSHKTPEPYKGKGILYEDEKITLKEGKKV